MQPLSYEGAAVLPTDEPSMAYQKPFEEAGYVWITYNNYDRRMSHSKEIGCRWASRLLSA